MATKVSPEEQARGEDRTVRKTQALCVVCGHYVGPAALCGHCGARQGRRMSLRALRWAAVLLATAGLFILYLMARHRDIPLVQVADITPTMNFAYVRLQGTAVADARVFRRPDGRATSLRVTVDDGTGELSVVAYAQQAQALLDAGWRPRTGDRVEVAGGLSVSAEQRMDLRIQVPEHCRILETAAPAVGPPVEPAEDLHAVAAVQPDWVGRRVTVTGRVAEVRYPAAGSRQPVQVLLRDGADVLRVIYWERVARTLSYQPAPEDILQVSGEIQTYREQLQLRVERAANIRPLTETTGARP